MAKVSIIKPGFENVPVFFNNNTAEELVKAIHQAIEQTDHYLTIWKDDNSHFVILPSQMLRDHIIIVED